MSLARPRLSHLLALLLTAACQRGERPLFEELSARRTGVDFANTITTSDSLNVQTDVYVYNGAGVAVGDVNNDGRPDLFFSGNMVSSRLYLNRGDMKFEDATTQAGVRTDRWATGATMADVNADGWLDIYVSVSGPEWSNTERRANLLFVNNHDGTFTESAARYGIADTNFTTHSAFLDYDRDGCLDLFVLNNSPKDFKRGEDVRHPTGMRGQTSGSYNTLYHNDCNGHFADVSIAAGILRTPGYGLGVVVADMNVDGWPDIYVSNDANPNDVLYINNRNGTFTDRAAQSLKHTSYAGMGVDAADVNEDGWPDLVQADMQPAELQRRKRMSGFITQATTLDQLAKGYRVDYSVNALQIANGITAEGDVVYSDVAALAGMASTDWSWSTLFADFDDDGHKDVFISNGYPKAVNDLDYQSTMFSLLRSPDSVGARRQGLELLKSLPGYDVPNYLFRNRGDLTFEDASAKWGVSKKKGYGYGAAYADLDGDGRLDLVVSNIDGPASIYRNRGPIEAEKDAHHWLSVRLKGDKRNPRGIGARVIATSGGRRQHVYVSPYRGYMSSVDERAHFGLGRTRVVDTLEVTWPDGRRQRLANVAADRELVVDWSQATPVADSAPSPAKSQLFAAMPRELAPSYVHRLASTTDYGVQPLLPYRPSRQGPALAVADVNGDGLEDVFVGGGARSAGRLFLRRADGGFVPASPGQPWETDSTYEDWGAQFVDVNGDRRPDLYVASGGYQLAPESQWLQDRLYVNRGGGRFVRDTAALPRMTTSTAVVSAGDYDGDGRPDLFVGGRLTPRGWPRPTRSYVLHNEGGRFRDVTAQVAPQLVDSGGMVTDAAWVDYDGDGRLDLVTVGEWMPITFLRNEDGRFRDATAATGLPPMRGWWWSLATGDFDGDGRVDLVAGNVGLNAPWSTAPGHRLGVVAGDFTGNGSTDVVLTTDSGGVALPFAGLVPLGRELYPVGLKFPTYASFSTATVQQALGEKALASAVRYRTDTFASVILHNEGGGKLRATALPSLAQLAPVRGLVVRDVDGDGRLDVVLAGNLYDVEPNTARLDAGNGLWLRGDGRGGFIPVPANESGLLVPKNVAGLALLDGPAGRILLVANTGDTLQAFSVGRR